MREQREHHPSAGVQRPYAEDELVLLADAQTSGGLLVAGELPGWPAVGELVPRREATVVVR